LAAKFLAEPGGLVTHVSLIFGGYFTQISLGKKKLNFSIFFMGFVSNGRHFYKHSWLIENMDSQQPIFLMVDIKRRNASKSVNHCDFYIHVLKTCFFCVLFRDSFKFMFSGLYLRGQIACSFWFQVVSEFFCLFV